MEYIIYIFDFLVHLDMHIKEIIDNYGMWIYLIMFIVIFCETGFVVTPFLPGDSLLFILGAFAASGEVSIYYIALMLIIAAITGNIVNFHVGSYVGPLIFEREKIRFLKKEYLIQTHDFYERHGGKTIIIARFLPIIRTFAPFVAGIAQMEYKRFLIYNIVGSVAWVTLFIMGGYFFGNIPWVQKNLTIIILLILVISTMPAIIGFFRVNRQTAANNSSTIK